MGLMISELHGKGLATPPTITESISQENGTFALSLNNFSENTPSSNNPFLSKWDFRWIKMAEEVKTWSKDPRKKVGCVLVKGKRDIAKGYNGLPEKLSDDLSRLKNPEFKDKVIIHAEKNAIYHALDFGIPVRGCTAYITYHPCARCASMLIEVGISKIVCPSPKLAPPKWEQDFSLSSNILYEAGILVLYYDPEVYLP
jgi:dCMP deaminase